MRRAVIDIGTNSVKLLVGEVADQTVQPLLEQSEQTRLGRGFYAARRLQPEAIRQTAEVVAAFLDEARRWHAASIRVIATSAAREAFNGADLRSALAAAAGVELEIITGEQEADWAYRGVTTDVRLVGQPLLIMDVGGGSLQLIYASGRARPNRYSFPLGAVRLLEKLAPADPPAPTDWQRCETYLHQFVDQHIRPPLESAGFPGQPQRLPLVGTGGSSSLLATLHLGLTRFDRDVIERTVLARDQVQAQCQRLWGLTLAQRQSLPGLPPAKADVILMGAAIHAAILESLDLLQLRISTRGLRFAVLLES